MSVIDSTALDNMIGGDEELLADLATMFIQFLPDVEGRIRVALENRDAPRVESVFHQLRSRVSYFGAISLQQLAKQIEQQAKAGDLDEIEVACKKMMIGIDELLSELRERTRLPLEKCQE